MPRYDYRCPQCHRQDEYELPMDHTRPFCPDCREATSQELVWGDVTATYENGVRETRIYMRRVYSRPPLVPPSRVQS